MAKQARKVGGLGSLGGYDPVLTPLGGEELLMLAAANAGPQMRGYEPSLREQIGNVIYDAAGGLGGLGGIRNRIRDEAMIGLDFIPGLGEAVGVDDTSRAFNAGNYLDAAVNGAATGVGMFPIGGDILAGALKAIVPVPAARALATARNLPNDDIFRSAVANTPGARIEEDGVVLPLVRNQRPEQAGQDSVRGGVFYLPEGSKDAKFYTGTGHNFAYGGTERIRGETLVSNPLFVKGATGGKAPEAAYDQIMGKGAYQKMRQEVLNHAVVPSYVKDQSLKAEQISKFLEKYAPELVGLEYEILANSSKGNQLAYALQEAAVASAARRAGHDAVIGYSTKRSSKEPFISEVFDVRERTYPTKQGDFDVWPDFEK
jgi:hypothetical protein